jgi:hypothetical protein
VTAGQGADWVAVDYRLDAGWSESASLSGDMDDNNNAEVWTIMLEKAYSRKFGFPPTGGSSHEVWERILGYKHKFVTVEAYSPDGGDTIIPGKTNEYLVSLVRTKLSEGAKLIIGTKGTFSDPRSWTFGEYSFVGNHAYVVLGIEGDFLKLFNPRAPITKNEPLLLPLSELKNVSKAIHTDGETP